MSKTAYRPGIHAVALFAAAFTLPLLYVGGSVTTYRVGMAVPDWPTTFQENMFRYDFWNAPFGVRVEHTHRLYGAAVGMASIVLAGCLLAFEPRRWMKGLGVLALAAVIGQGVLGGLRVTRVSTLLAAVHGCTGQAFFGLLVALCVFTGRDWNAGTGRAADPDHLRGRCALALALVYGQILVGGWLRHFATPSALWAPFGPGGRGPGRMRRGSPEDSRAGGRTLPGWSGPRDSSSPRWPPRSCWGSSPSSCCGRWMGRPAPCRCSRPSSGRATRPTRRSCSPRRSS